MLPTSHYRSDYEPGASDPVALGLQALGWIVRDSSRLDRLLGVTGLDPAGLRARAAEPALLVAVLGFLEAHQPDLLACADEIAVEPAVLVRAREALER